MWAPWRMPYIQQSEPVSGCLFCTKAEENEDEKNMIVHRSGRCFIMMNRYPYNSGHLMVIPYQHTGVLSQIESATGAELFHVTQLAVRALSTVMKPEGFNVGINQGEVAGAGVADHIHIHVVPRWNGDTNFMPVVAGTKVIPELLAATAEKLRPVLAELEPKT
ncbi:MAG TPA: HIT domain-containing protein [Chloroflexota bacterium]|nr:HIT domain-containing protein [Chloroflexota bacterium]